MHSVETVQRAYTTILQYIIEHGRAPHYTELANLMGLVPDSARDLQREAAAAAPIGACWMSHDTDYIESWAPFSIIPTQHKVRVDGLQRWYGQ